MTETQPITNAQVLLSQGLVEYYDPIEDVMRQTDIETAKRIATVNTTLHAHLVELGVITIEEQDENTD